LGRSRVRKLTGTIAMREGWVPAPSVGPFEEKKRSYRHSIRKSPQGAGKPGLDPRNVDFQGG